jgi:hypothetical protein
VSFARRLRKCSEFDIDSRQVFQHTIPWPAMNPSERIQSETTEKTAPAFLVWMLVALAGGLALSGGLGHNDLKNREAIETIEINTEHRPF